MRAVGLRGLSSVKRAVTILGYLADEGLLRIGEFGRSFWMSKLPFTDRELRVSVELGRLYPLHAVASSLCILAAPSGAEVDEYLSVPLSRVAEATMTQPAKLRTQVDTVRASGTATWTGQRQIGFASIAAPVFSAPNEVVGSLSVCGPADRLDLGDERLRHAVLEEAMDRAKTLAGGACGR